MKSRPGPAASARLVKTAHASPRPCHSVIVVILVMALPRSATSVLLLRSTHHVPCAVCYRAPHLISQRVCVLRGGPPVRSPIGKASRKPLDRWMDQREPAVRHLAISSAKAILCSPSLLSPQGGGGEWRLVGGARESSLKIIRRRALFQPRARLRPGLGIARTSRHDY